MPDLSDNVNWSEVDSNNNQAPPNGWPEGMMPSGVNDAARADRGAMKRFWDKINPVQYVTPVGGVYTFTTGNTTYPTAYTNGEVYCFWAQSSSVGGDQFQVNTLGPKPIMKRVRPGVGGIVAIGASDLAAGAVQLVYEAAFNGGTGGFFLINPYVPVNNDGTGAGGSVMHGNLVINRNSAAPPPVVGTTTTSVPLQLIGNDGEGPVCALNSFGVTPFALRFIHAQGIGTAPTHTNSGDSLGNLAWEGYGATGWAPTSARIVATALENFTDVSQGTNLTFTTTPVGQNATVTQAVIGPGLTVGTPPAPSGGMLVGDLNAQRVFCAGNLTATGLTVNGPTTLNGTLTDVANRILVTGSTVPSLTMLNTGTGDAFGIWNGAGNFTFGRMDNTGAPTGFWGYFDGSTGDLWVDNNLHVNGTLNGHPASVFDTLITQIEELTSRVATLEAEVQTLRGHV